MNKKASSVTIFHGKFVPLHPSFQKDTTYYCSIILPNCDLERDLSSKIQIRIGAAHHSADSTITNLGLSQAW